MTFLDDAKKPFNILTTLLAILGISLGIFFYIKSIKTKAISYQINERSSIIFNSKNSSSKIQVLERIPDTSIKKTSDTISKYLLKPIQNNVYLLTGVIWNSGDLPINKEDLRKKIVLNLKSVKRILDFKIVQQIDSEVARFTLTQDKNNSLDLTWKYFDPGYALKFQIIYTGDENAGFDLDGKILGIREFENISLQNKQQGFTWILASNILICIVFAIILRVEYKKKSSKFNILVSMLVIIVNLMPIVSAVYSIMYTPNIPIPIP